MSSMSASGTCSPSGTVSAEVVRWLSRHDRIDEASVVDVVLTIRDLNEAPEVRNDAAVLERRMKFLRRLRGRKRTTR